MIVRRFIGKVMEHYFSILKGVISSFFPETYYTRHYIPHKQYREYLSIHTVWLGQTLETEVFELADSPKRRKLLKTLFEEGKITEQEYKRCLSLSEDSDKQ